MKHIQTNDDGMHLVELSGKEYTLLTEFQDDETSLEETLALVKILIEKLDTFESKLSFLMSRQRR